MTTLSNRSNFMSRSHDSHPAFGVWEVVRFNELPRPETTPDELEDDIILVGVFKGFVDDIAFRLMQQARSSEGTSHLFRRAPIEDGVVLPNQANSEYIRCLVDVEIEGELLSETPQRIASFFEGRPVVAEFWRDDIRLTLPASPEGQVLLNHKADLTAILDKLSDREIEVLSLHGLRPYTFQP